MLRRVTVKLPGSDERAVIVFSKGYHEPEGDTVKGRKRQKESKCVAFFSTNTRLHASATIIYALRLWDFSRGLFNVTISKIFELFKIEEEWSSYISVLTETICTSTPIQGCET